MVEKHFITKMFSRPCNSLLHIEAGKVTKDKEFTWQQQLA